MFPPRTALVKKKKKKKRIVNCVSQKLFSFVHHIELWQDKSDKESQIKTEKEWMILKELLKIWRKEKGREKYHKSKDRKYWINSLLRDNRKGKWKNRIRSQRQESLTGNEIKEARSINNVLTKGRKRQDKKGLKEIEWSM